MERETPQDATPQASMPTLEAPEPPAAPPVVPTVAPPLTPPAEPPAGTARVHASPAVVHVREAKPFYRVALEVALIAGGVFLGLMGDQWRERAQHRELAQASLRRFRDEFRTNRAAVAAVRRHHVDGLAAMQAWFRASPAEQRRLGFPFRGTHPAFMEYTAWEVALATQSLGHVDSDLAHAISHVYAIQRQLDGATRDITLVMYMKAGDPTEVSFLSSMATYFGDCNLIEPRLLAEYYHILPRLDRALAGARTR